MKTILAIWHNRDKGKTETLRQFASLLFHHPAAQLIFLSAPTIPSTGDLRLVVRLNGKVIAVETQGDPETQLEQRLNDLILQYHCDVVLCATRVHGKTTVTAVSNIAIKYGYEELWTSTYDMSNRADDALANDLKARHIYELLTALGRI